LSHRMNARPGKGIAMSDPINPFASPQADLAPAPGEQWVRDLSSSLRQTGLGLALILYGIVAVGISLLVLVFGEFVARGVGAGIVMVPVGVGAVAGVVVGCLLMFAGPLVCLAVPAETGAKGLIVGSVLLQLALTGCVVALQLLPVRVPPVVAPALGLLGVVGAVLFILFMKKLAEYIGHGKLAALARSLLVIFAVVVLLGVANVGGNFTEPVLAARASEVELVQVVLGFTLLADGLIAFVMYATLVNGLRNALRRRAPLISVGPPEDRKP
jgi:hypothetical protein